MSLRNLRSSIFYAPLRATEAAVNKIQVLGRYAEDLLTTNSVKIKKPSRYVELTAARVAEDIFRNGKAPPLSVPPPAPAPKASKAAGKKRGFANDDDFAQPPQYSGSPDVPKGGQMYSRWDWLDYAPG